METSASIPRFRTAWENLSRRARLLFFGVGLGLAVWLVLAAFVFPRRTSRLRLEEEVRGLVAGVEVLRLQLEALRNEARGEEPLRQALTELHLRLEETLARLPESRALSAFLRDLTFPEEGDEIVFLAITPHPFEKRGELLELPFTLEIEGTFPSVSRYLARLESLPRLVAVREVNLRSQSGKPLALRASVAAGTFVLGQGP